MVFAVGSANDPLVVDFLVDLGVLKILFRPELYSTDPSAERFSRSLQNRNFHGTIARSGHHGDGFQESIPGICSFPVGHLFF